jgi:hypothetical protein
VGSVQTEADSELGNLIPEIIGIRTGRKAARRAIAGAVWRVGEAGRNSSGPKQHPRNLGQR